MAADVVSGWLATAGGEVCKKMGAPPAASAATVGDTLERRLATVRGRVLALPEAATGAVVVGVVCKAALVMTGETLAAATGVGTGDGPGGGAVLAGSTRANRCC